jgi:hypothetical protein
MNKTKKMSILFATIGILAFSLIPAASAGVPRFMQRPDYWNNLLGPFFVGPDVEFSASEDLYFRIGWGCTEEELENDWAPKNPWKFKLFINDEEINLQRYDVKADKTAGIVKVSYWYHIFGPGYFEAEGEYLLRFEFWVKRPYQGDGKNYWRIFVDYGGHVWGDPGTVASYEYYLNIIA